MYYCMKGVGSGMMSCVYYCRKGMGSGMMSCVLLYEGCGIRDDELCIICRKGMGSGMMSTRWLIDGCRQLIWYNAHSENHQHPCWKPGE